MAKTLFLIPIHSLVDVIINSSSELFVCDMDKSIEEVNTMLSSVLTLYNSQSSEKLYFEDVFSDPWIATDINQVDAVLNDFFGKDSEYGKRATKEYKHNIIVIESTGDNTIPYVIQEWIEEVFKGERFHLG